MKKLIYLFLILCPILGISQLESNQRAKLYFQEAQKQFNQNEYDEALIYIQKTEDVLENTNGRILNLKIKTLYNQGSFIEAETALNQFIDYHSDSVTNELREETLAYFVRIENAAKANKQKNSQDQVDRTNYFNSQKSINPKGLPLTYEQDGKFGLIGSEGEIISPFKWQFAKSVFKNKIQEQLYFVQSFDNYFGVYDMSNREWLFKEDGVFYFKGKSDYDYTHEISTLYIVNEKYKNTPIVYHVAPKNYFDNEEARIKIYNNNGKLLKHGAYSFSLLNNLIIYRSRLRGNRVSRGASYSSNYEAGNKEYLIDTEGNSIFDKFATAEIIEGSNLIALNTMHYNSQGTYKTGYIFNDEGRLIISSVYGYRYSKISGNKINIYTYEKPEKYKKEKILIYDFDGNKVD